MNYRVYFASGNTLVINEERYNQVFDNAHIERRKFIQEGFPYINVSNVDFIIPEPEVSSGIKSSPRPEDIAEKKKEKEDSIKGDSTQILDRAKADYEKRV